jgi:hypothetical protein
MPLSDSEISIILGQVRRKIAADWAIPARSFYERVGLVY